MSETLTRRIAFSPPDITELEMNGIVEALNSGWITTGPKTKQFEQQIAAYVGVNKAVCLNSATAAMELTLRILGIGPGDEVITTAYTYTATAAVIAHVGAKLVLVDTGAQSFEMDYIRLEQAITEKTKLIIAVDFAGKICDYSLIYRAVESKRHLYKPANQLQETISRIIVMADAAHAFGAKQADHMCGQIADFTCFSFHAVKNLTTAEGGAVVWRNDLGLKDEELYKQYMLYSLHGQSKDAFSKSQLGSWEYDVLIPGYKCNMTDLTAAVGLAQLERYEQLLAKRFDLIKGYEQALLPDAQFEILTHYGSGYCSSGHLFIVRIVDYTEEQRNRLIHNLAEVGIATNVHYKPLPMLTAYRNLGFSISDYTNSRAMYQNEITLPLHTQLTMDDVDFITSTIMNLIHKD